MSYSISAAVAAGLEGEIVAKQTGFKTYLLALPDIWQRLLEDFGRNPGTYRLLVTEPEGGTPMPLRRLLDTDPRGTLYYGTSQDLPVRVTALSRSICAVYKVEGYTARPHGIHRQIGPRFVETFPLGRLQVEVHSYEQGESFNHYTEEWRLLMRYVEQFGEFPPLNGPKPSAVADEIEV